MQEGSARGKCNREPYFLTLPRITLQHSAVLEIPKFKHDDHYLFVEISLHDNKPVFSKAVAK